MEDCQKIMAPEKGKIALFLKQYLGREVGKGLTFQEC